MSTPHRTEAGKRSSLKAMKYGSTGQLVVMPEEDLELYESHKKSFQAEYQPQGATEEHLVQALADVSWRLNRVALLESNLLSISYTPRDLIDGMLDQTKALANLSLHSQRLSRQFERTIAQLHELQEARRIQMCDGFVFSKQSWPTKSGTTAPRRTESVVKGPQAAPPSPHLPPVKYAHEAFSRLPWVPKSVR
jgi:hypothetical protein